MLNNLLKDWSKKYWENRSVYFNVKREDVEFINYIAFHIYLDKMDKINQELTRQNKDYRTAYIMYDYFISSDLSYNYIKQANRLLREEKIKKLFNEI